MDYVKIRKYYVQVKDFLLGNANREFLTFLFFLLISSAFWLLQALNETYEVEISVPLNQVNVPKNVVITSELPEELKVVVRDKGTVLSRYLYGVEVPPVDVDYNTYDTGLPSGHVLVDMSTIQKRVQSQFLASTQIVSIKPDTLEYFFNRGASKRVPVKYIGVVSSEPEYYIKSVTFSPDSVDIFAPPTVLDTITAAYVVTSNYTELSSAHHSTEELRNVRGGKFIPDAVEMNVEVDMFTEKTVEVPIVGTNFPGNKILRTFPSKAKVVFRVGMSRFKDISEDDFVISVPYDEVLSNKSKKLKLNLQSYPQDVTNIRILPQEVDYLLEQLQDDVES